jgi:hypothetical protein
MACHSFIPCFVAFFLLTSFLSQAIKLCLSLHICRVVHLLRKIIPVFLKINNISELKKIIEVLKTNYYFNLRIHLGYGY